MLCAIQTDDKFCLPRSRYPPLAMSEALAAEAGALLQVNPDVPGCARRSANFVDLILKGANPRDLGIERYSPIRYRIQSEDGERTRHKPQSGYDQSIESDRVASLGLPSDDTARAFVRCRDFESSAWRGPTEARSNQGKRKATGEVRRFAARRSCAVRLAEG